MTALAEISEKGGRVVPNAPWPTVPLGDIAEIKLGKMLDKAKHLSGRRLPYLRNVNVRWGSVDTDDLREMNFDDDELDRFGLKAGDVLVCEGGEPGRAAVWNGHLSELKFQKAIHRVRFKQPFEAKLLVYHLELLAKTGGLERRFTGSTIKHFTREAFVQLPIPLPPFPEQRRIVAEVEKQITRMDAGVAALRRTQANLKRYRAAVLKAACESRLVPTEADLARKNPCVTGSILGGDFDSRSHGSCRSTLQRCVQFFLAVPNCATWRNLTWAHYKVLIPIEDSKLRRTLATEADRNQWPVERWQARIARTRARGGDRSRRDSRR